MLCQLVSKERRVTCQRIKSPRKQSRQQGSFLYSLDHQWRYRTSSPARYANSLADGEISDVVGTRDLGTSSPFEEMFYTASTLCLPTQSWAAHRFDTEGFRGHVFHDTSLLRTSDGACVLFHQECVHVHFVCAVLVFFLFSFSALLFKQKRVKRDMAV